MHTDPIALPRFSGPTVSTSSANPTVHTTPLLAPCRSLAIVRTAMDWPTAKRTVARASMIRPSRNGSWREDDSLSAKMPDTGDATIEAAAYKARSVEI